MNCKTTINKLLLFALFIACFCMYSCDIFSVAQIKNNSQNDIEIQVRYDTQAMKEHYGNTEYRSYFKKFSGISGTIKNLDTVNLISTIKLTPKDSLIIEFGRGYKPNFNLIKCISVFGKDTLVLNDKSAMLPYFEETEDQLFVMVVK